ncbi:hypothetical protein Phum_PHUM543950 [Pediculus humanus corporis]|uniref:Uncharacterized protein n=1 Tax=Pediculus humanus subsp. corporis TaxID=121224 RepID=E0W025_PEDHC|nr:uncharacterized protein Phum_PHUM543950 [Pediculus humanus corporis]EEB18981.1 hypothetical protein Phum_PHUM543950 [Pediculus humanus corporis]
MSENLFFFFIERKEIKQTSHGELKTLLNSSKKIQNKETILQKTGVQRYTEFPSLRYSATPNQTSFSLRNSGPLRLSFGTENNYRKSKSCEITSSSKIYKDDIKNDCNGDVTPVRRVHFAELPPKSNSVIVSSSPRFARYGLSTSASFPFPIKIHGLKLENNHGGGESVKCSNVIVNSKQNQTTNVRCHSETFKTRRSNLNQINHTTQLPEILRAAKDGNDDEVTEILRKASIFGIPSDELNAVDGSGRSVK